MKFTFSANGGPPPGNYRAEFTGAEPFEGNTEFGPAVRLGWRILDGDYAEEEASRICSAKLSGKSNLSKFAVALKGGSLEAGEEFDFDAYVGSSGSIVCEPTESGGSRVSMFLRDAE